MNDTIEQMRVKAEILDSAAKFGGCLATLFIALGSAFLWAFVVQTCWPWYAPSVSAGVGVVIPPTIGYWNAFALHVSLMTITAPMRMYNVKKDDKPDVVFIAFMAVVAPAISLLLAWTLSFFLPVVTL